MTETAPTVSRLTWDSDYFGFEIGRLNRPGTPDEMASALGAADREGIVCTYLLVDGGDPGGLAVAQAHGFRVVDVRVELARSLGDGGALPAGGLLRLAGVRDRAWVVALAGRRFAHSRFVTDGRFAPSAAAGLFERWAIRGFEEPDKAVVVAEHQGGFVVVGRSASVGSVDLITTAEDAPSGTGAALVRAAHARLTDDGCDVVEVVTQASNIAALRLYEKCGYRVIRSGYWLHRWGSASPAPRLAGR